MNDKNNNLTEISMQILTVLVVQELAKKENLTFDEVLNDFMQSKTADALYDSRTGLWQNGPDYIADEYCREISRRFC